MIVKDKATTEIYTLSLHDALPIYAIVQKHREGTVITDPRQVGRDESLEVTVSEGHFVVKASGSGGSVSKQRPPESDPPHGGQLPLLHAPSDAEEESS